MVLGGSKCINWRKFRCFLKNFQKNFLIWVQFGYHRGLFLQGASIYAKNRSKIAQNRPKKCENFGNLDVGGPGMVLGSPKYIWRKFRYFLKNFVKKFHIWLQLGHHRWLCLRLKAQIIPKAAKNSTKIDPKNVKILAISL